MASRSTPLRIGWVVRCGRSLTANDTASLKTSRLTWNFTQASFVDVEAAAWGVHTFTRSWHREEPGQRTVLDRAATGRDQVVDELR